VIEFYRAWFRTGIDARESSGRLATADRRRLI
jgi:hypothetical protein